MNSEKKKVIITLVDLHFGGISNLILRTTPHLQKYFTIYIVYFGPNEDMLERYQQAGINVQRINYRGGQDLLFTSIRLAKFIKEHKIDIVWTNFTPDKYLVSVARLFTTFSIVGMIHNAQDRKGQKPIKTWRSRFEEFFHNKVCKKVFFVSEAAFRVATQYKNFKNPNYVVVPSGIERLNESNTNFRSFSQGQNGSRTIFVTACRFVPVKGLERLINIFQEVNIRNKEWELWLVGDGILRNELEDKVHKLGLQGQVKFLGFQTSPEKFYKKSHFFINSSFDEALPVSVIEAISIGLPAIASNVGGIPEIIEPGVNGFLVDFNDEKSAVDIISKSMNMDQEKYREMSKAGKRIFEEKFSIQKYAEKLENELSNLKN